MKWIEVDGNERALVADSRITINRADNVFTVDFRVSAISLERVLLEVFDTLPEAKDWAEKFYQKREA